jgi:hypothetical protein
MKGTVSRDFRLQGIRLNPVQLRLLHWLSDALDSRLHPTSHPQFILFTIGQTGGSNHGGKQLKVRLQVSFLVRRLIVCDGEHTFAKRDTVLYDPVWYGETPWPELDALDKPSAV